MQYRGWLAGMVATIPMTLVMWALHRRLPKTQQTALPPEEIAIQASRKVNQPLHHDTLQAKQAGLIIHFAIGAGLGGLYDVAVRPWEISPALKGALFGLMVWGISYGKLLPGLRLYTPSPQEPIARKGLMVVAHLVWGPLLALLDEAGERRQARGMV